MIEQVKFWHVLDSIRLFLKQGGERKTAIGMLQASQDQITEIIKEHERIQSENRLEANCDVDRSSGHTG